MFQTIGREIHGSKASGRHSQTSRAVEAPGELFKTQTVAPQPQVPDSLGEEGLRICISNRLPDVAAAGPGTTVNGGQGGVEEKLLGTGERRTFEARVGETSCPPDALGRMVTSPVNDDNMDKYGQDGRVRRGLEGAGISEGEKRKEER